VGYGLYLLHGAAIVPRWIVPAALPAGASASTVIRGLGPFDTPVESHGISAGTQSLAADGPRLTTFMRQIERQQGRSRILLGIDTSVLAAPYIMVSGREVLPIGGYLGGVLPLLAVVHVAHPGLCLVHILADFRVQPAHYFQLLRLET
jgi:hypothetical protein